MNESFRCFVRRRRKAMGMTQAQLGQACGLTEISITLVEGGRRHLGLERVPRLAAVLGVDVAELCRMALADQLPTLAAALDGHSVIAAELN